MPLPRAQVLRRHGGGKGKGDTNQSSQTRDPPPNLGTVHQCPDLVCLRKAWLTPGAGVALLLLHYGLSPLLPWSGSVTDGQWDVSQPLPLALERMEDARSTYWVDTSKCKG